MASLRHYSGLRFAILTVYSGAMAGLIVAAYGGADSMPALALPRRIVQIGGLGLTLIFFWIEVTLDAIMTAVGNIAIALRPGGHWEKRPKWRARLVRIPLWGMYVLLGAFWAWALKTAAP